MSPEQSLFHKVGLEERQIPSGAEARTFNEIIHKIAHKTGSKHPGVSGM